MKTIRNSTFETNSSSTHSITIEYNSIKKESNIPRSSEEPYILSAVRGTFSDDYFDDTYVTEIDKAGFVLNIIASISEDVLDYDEYRIEDRDDKSSIDESYNRLINTKLFTWLKEVIFDETGTHIEFERPDSSYYPFFNTIYSEHSSLAYLLGLVDDRYDNIDSIDDIDKDKFKDKIWDIIFNQDCHVTSANKEY